MSVEINVGACAIGTKVGVLHKELRSAHCSAICICADLYSGGRNSGTRHVGKRTS